MILIDPPSPFAPLKEWKSHLAELKALKVTGQDKQIVAEHIAEAEEEISRLER